MHEEVQLAKEGYTDMEKAWNNLERGLLNYPHEALFRLKNQNSAPTITNGPLSLHQHKDRLFSQFSAFHTYNPD